MSPIAAATAVTTSSAGKAFTEAGFGDLVRENQCMVYSIAYNFFQQEPLAEEVAQDVFLQLYQNLGAMRSNEHITHWLRRVTSHRCIDYARKRAHVREISIESAPEPSSEASSPDPLLRDQLRKLVASLPAKRRLLIILRYQEEMELADIARTLGLRERTVRTQLWRTLAFLRSKAQRLMGGEVSP